VFQKLILVVGFAVMLAFLLPIIGCGGDGMVSISGTISLDGVLIENGRVRIAASDSPVSGSEVVNGKFTTRTTVGKKIVTVYAMKQDGETEETNPTTGEKTKVPKFVPLLDNGSMYGELTESYEIDVKKGGDKFTIELKSADLLKK
jgi:hypothetical protein